MPQLTFDDLSSLSFLSKLSDKQKSIIVLLGEQLLQADIARKLGCSRAYVNEFVKELLQHNLIKAVENRPGNRSGAASVRHYNQFFTLSSQLKQQVTESPTTAPPITPYHVHYIRRKFKIHTISGPLTRDKRSGYQDSWFMRGKKEWFKYWFSGGADEISVTLVITPKTIIAMMDKNQKVIASTGLEAIDRAVQQVRDAARKFIEQQRRFGVIIEADEIGVQIGKPHFSLLFHKSHPLATTQTTFDNTWIDSTAPGIKPNQLSYETDDPKRATELEQAILKVALIEKNLPKAVQSEVQTIIPEAMKGFNQQFGEVNEGISQLMAMTQGGITMQQQYQQMQNFMVKVLDEIAEVRKENQELKKRLGMV